MKVTNAQSQVPVFELTNQSYHSMHDHDHIYISVAINDKDPFGLNTLENLTRTYFSPVQTLNSISQWFGENLIEELERNIQGKNKFSFTNQVY